MLYSLLFPIACLVYLGMFTLSYFSKTNKSYAQNRIYRYMLLATILYVFVQIIAVTILNYHGDGTLVKTFWRISFDFCIMWYALFYFYSVALIAKSRETNLFSFIKATPYRIIMAVIFLIGIIVYSFFLPYAGLDKNDMTYVPGNTAIIVWAFCLVIDALIVLTVVKQGKDLTKKEKLVIIISLVFTLAFMSVQVLIPSISIIPLAFGLEMYYLYFSTENPDLVLIEESENARKAIEASNREKTKILSGIAYEINEPMQTVSKIANDLSVTPYNEESAKTCLKQISEYGLNLVDAVDVILDVSRINGGETGTGSNNYNIADTVRNLVNATTNMIGTKKISINVDVDSNISSVLNGDEEKLYQCVSNVLANAVKYTEVGKIGLTVVGTKNNNNEVLLFKVSDTGVGIKPEEVNNIFKDNIDSNDFSNPENGRGISLTLTKKFLESMGGRIWFESNYRVGSTFFIEVTQKVVNPAPIGTFEIKTEVSADKVKLDCSNYKLLIVDDDKLNIKVIKRLIADYKFQVDSANSGDECIKKIKSGAQYDLIFLDDRMPELSGLETVKIIKQLAPNICPVIVLTANALAGMKESYLNKGFDGYLSKPIDLVEVDNVIEKFLDKQK